MGDSFHASFGNITLPEHGWQVNARKWEVAPNASIYVTVLGLICHATLSPLEEPSITWGWCRSISFWAMRMAS